MSAEAGVLRGGVLVAEVEVRVLKTEAHSLTSTPTMYPVESGNTVIDHVTLNPNGVLFRVEMTNTNRGTEEARNVMEKFVQMRDKREPMELMTEHAMYKNMVLIGIFPVHQAPFKGALVLDLRFHQMGVVGAVGLVGKSGGRPARKLEPDGTQATASNYIYAGEVQPIVGGALGNKVEQALRALGRY